MRRYRPLKREVVAVGVGDREPAHVVHGGVGLLQNVDTERKKLIEGGVRVGAAEEERGVVVHGKARGVRRGRALAFVISVLSMMVIPPRRNMHQWK